PYSVVLFDEIEKAHPDVFNMLLQVLDDGRLTDSLGHVVDFKNTILIMTSNLGTALIGKRTTPGFLSESAEDTYDRMKDRVIEELKRAFRPEFLNRIDEVIVFHSLSEDHIRGVVTLMLERVNRQLEERAIRVSLSAEAAEFLITKGFDATYGARQLRRTIQKHIEDPLAEAIIAGQVQDGAHVEVRVEGERLIFEPVSEPSLSLAER
ncbi:MAG: AAA family ATPase, partial [Candidatus Rokuibacteriota bacterium]